MGLNQFEIVVDKLNGGRGTVALNNECQSGYECETPLDTINSWDSHTHYRQCIIASDQSLYTDVIVYCDHTYFKSPSGIIRFLLIVSMIACLTCLCTSGTVKVGLFMLPLAGRIRFMMFVNILGLFITCVLLFLDVTHIIYLFPLNWTKLIAYIYLSLGTLFLIASSLILHMIFLSDTFSWISKWTKHQLLVSGFIGYVCSAESLLIAIIQHFSRNMYYSEVEDLQEDLQESHAPSYPMNQGGHIYKPLQTYQPLPTSSDTHLELAQSCSSRSFNLKYQIT